MNNSNIEICKTKFHDLKTKSGSHSPSIKSILKEIPEIKLKTDACFLSNPYATDLFLKYLKSDYPTYDDLRDVLEFYPPQNAEIAKSISSTLNLSPKNVFVGNGAIEIISASIKQFCSKKILVPIPTFSSYYEFINEDQEVFYHELLEKDDYQIDVNKLISDINCHNIDSIVLINPNNPNGHYLSRNEIIAILDKCKNLSSVILDESFVHFAYEDDNLELTNYYDLIDSYDNLIIIKSMSKDFGIAGIRAGYGIMSEKRVNHLLKSDYLWNISGLASYFFDLYSLKSFRDEYEVVRKKYIMNTLMFKTELNQISGIRVFPSKANFFLIKVDADKNGDFGLRLLINHGVYIRDCSDKIGLKGSGYYRIASRSFEENIKIINGLKIESN
jgi:histidinol-phosphate/aromatic aminotransferase/cobyric acid decarboxylase-like protein